MRSRTAATLRRWLATNVPLPWYRTKMPCATSSRKARRTVPWLTPNIAATSSSLGSMLSVVQTPFRMLSSIFCLTSSNSGKWPLRP